MAADPAIDSLTRSSVPSEGPMPVLPHVKKKQARIDTSAASSQDTTDTQSPPFADTEATRGDNLQSALSQPRPSPPVEQSDSTRQPRSSPPFGFMHTTSRGAHSGKSSFMFGRVTAAMVSQDLASAELSALQRLTTSRPFAFFVGVLLATTTAYLNSDNARDYLYGPQWRQGIWDREWLWYFVMVPCYSLTFIFASRYLGSFLARTWTAEIIDSEMLTDAMLKFLECLGQDKRIPQLVAKMMEDQEIFQAVSYVLGTVVGSGEVSLASAELVRHTLSQDEVQGAAVALTVKLLQDPEVRDLVAVFVDAEEIAPALVELLALVMDEEPLRHEVAEFIQLLLQQPEVKGVIAQRAKSFAGDAELYQNASAGAGQAAKQGILSSFGAVTSRLDWRAATRSEDTSPEPTGFAKRAHLTTDGDTTMLQELTTDEGPSCWASVECCETKRSARPCATESLE